MVRNPAEARSVAELIAFTGRIKYLHFWGHTPPRSGEISAACLSQWWKAEFAVDGITYRTAEHYMMAAKARLFGDTEKAERIVRAGHPGDAKALGREVQGFDQQKWEEERFRIVVDANLAKFDQNRELKTFLLGTGNRVLASIFREAAASK